MNVGLNKLERPKPDDSISKLLVDRRTAAKMLSISERTLFDWTAAGIIPCLKIRGRVLFSVDALRAQIAKLQHEAQQTAPAETDSCSFPDRLLDENKVDGTIRA
jgi:hypothetical protein